MDQSDHISNIGDTGTNPGINDDGTTGTVQKFKRSTLKQVVLGLLANFSSIAPSMSLGFSAVAIPALTKAGDINALTPEQSSWFASIASLATPFGCFFAGPIADRFGRRSAMMAVNVICFIGWLTIAAAYYAPEQQYVILLIGRILTGLSTGLSSMPATIYMAEISTSKLRSVFCTWSTVSFAIGVLIIYILGFGLKDYWGTIALISAAFPCIGMLFVVFLIPESPAWLVSKNRIDEAKTNMCKIFGVKDYIPEVRREIDVLIKNKSVKTSTKQKTMAQQAVRKIKHLLKPNALKPFFIIVAFFFFQQFSGTFSIVFYAIDIVKEAGVTIDAYISIVMIGVVRLAAAMLMSYFSKIFGRRPLSIISGCGMTICMIMLAVYILLLDQGTIGESTKNSLTYTPIILLLFYFLTSTVGFLPLPFAMAPEVFPAKVRGTAASLTSCIGYFFNFITVKIYPNMIDGMGSQGVFFFYGAMSLAGTIFVTVMLPETRGKTLQEIEEYFARRKSRKRNSLLEASI